MREIFSNSMISYKKYFEGKKVTKQGFGILGRGFGVVKFLLDAGADVLVTDTKPREYFQKQIDEIEQYTSDNNLTNKIEWVLGEHRVEDFINCDFVIQASGVPKGNIYLNHAKQNGINVYQEGSLFCEIVRDFNVGLEEKDKVKIIGTTGTRGKTTTTFLIHHVLSDFFGADKVYFGGNVQGVATLENLKNIKAGDFVVMELDSWMLQGFADIEYSPDIAVFTNFMADHMNYYKNDMDEYFADKANIFLYQKDNDILITHENMRERIDGVTSKGKKVFITQREIDEDKNKYESSLGGEHNRYYISIAKHVAQILNISDESFIKSVASFKGVAGRQELARELGGVRYINDTTATTGEASMVALDTFSDNKIVLITGGRDKELDMINYANKIIDLHSKGIIKKAILLNNGTTTGTHKLIEILKEKNFNDYVLSDNINAAVNFARESANDGDVVLFTPAFASFGMFENEYDRGDKYNAAVKSL